MTLGKWTTTFVVIYSILEAAFVGIAGLILGVPLRSLLAPYLMLLSCALVLAPLVYWVLQVKSRPKSCATRFAAVIFCYLLLFSFVVAFNVVKLGIVSRKVIVNDSIPWMFIGSAITSAVVYVTARRKLEAANN